jgi:hypothetical protein
VFDFPDDLVPYSSLFEHPIAGIELTIAGALAIAAAVILARQLSTTSSLPVRWVTYCGAALAISIGLLAVVFAIRLFTAALG